MDYPKTIAEAAGILDAAKPKWRSKINIDRLEMAKGHDCILGQLYGQWTVGIKTLFGQMNHTLYHTRIKDNIFGYEANNDEWIKMIQNKVNAVHDWNWVVSQLKLGEKVRQPNWPQDCFIVVNDGLICTQNGYKYIFGIDIFDQLNWEIYKIIHLNDLKPGQKFAFKEENSEGVCVKLCGDGNYHTSTFNIAHKSSNNLKYLEVILKE